MLNRVLSTLTGGESETDTETTPADWPYVWSEDSVENVEGQAVISHGTDEHGDDVVFAGPLARDMMQAAYDDPESPVYVGVGTRRGRHAAIERQYLRRHLAVFGVTGYGKSTLLRVLARQVLGESGMAIFDPKGDDSKELMQVIPPERLDDVVWVEPGNMRSAATGFNFLEVGVDPDHPLYPTLETNVVDDLVQMIGLDEYWGPRMDGIARNLIRATSRMDQSFTLLDLYFIIATEENRQRYAEMVSQAGHRFLSVYADAIAQMNEDDLDAIRRRLQRWVEDPLARQLISHRDSSLDVESVVEDGKIMIVRMGAASEDLKGMVGTALIRRLWSTIRARAELRQTERDTFYITVDEADLVLKEDSGVLSILSKGRSLGTSFTVCCQQPSQLPDSVVSGIYGNCDTVLSFSPGSPDDSKAVAKNLDMDAQTLRRESNYHIWMQVTLSDTRERSDAFRVYTFPQPPAVRTEPEAIHAIERIVRRDGRPHQSDAEQLDQLVINSGEGAAEQVGMAEESSPTLEVTDRVEEATIAAIYGVSVRQGNPGGEVQTEDAVGAVRRSLARLEETPDAKELQDLLTDGDTLYQRVLQYIPEDTLVHSDSTVRPKTPRKTLAGVGESPSDGGQTHAQIMWDAWEGLAWAGLDMLILDTGGDDPDGVAWPAPEDEQHNPELVEKLVGQGVDAESRIESEKSTTETKGGFTVQHVLQAAEEGRQTITLCRPGAVETTTDKLLREPQFARSGHDTEGETRFYNVGELKISQSGERRVMTRPGSRDNVWVRDHESGDIVLRDDAGTEHARFEDPRMAFTDPHSYPSDGDRTITRPVIPETFDMDTEPHAEILSVPEGADGLGDLSVVADSDGLTIPAKAVGRDESDEPTVDPADLDVPENARDFLRFLREHEAVDLPVTVTQATELANEHGAENLHVSRQSVNKWMNALNDEGAVAPVDTDGRATTWTPV